MSQYSHRRWLQQLARGVPGARAAYRKVRELFGVEPYPRGHYHSPLPDVHSVVSQDHLFRGDHFDPSIDLNVEEQRKMLDDLFELAKEFTWTRAAQPGRRFHLDQGFFGYSDGLALWGMMRRFKPKKIIEVGSGFSSALMLDVCDMEFKANPIEMTFIEPYPDRLLGLLGERDPGRTRLVKEFVQRVPVERFLELGPNDILFIDSSHVAKVGSDVNFLFFEVLPRLAEGVVVHVHDIFWPFEYPKHWISRGWAWNENYLLHAFLQFNRAYKVLFFNSFAAYKFAEKAKTNEEFAKLPGGSIWMQRVKV